jgi:cell shape-determining protein MreC
MTTPEIRSSDRRRANWLTAWLCLAATGLAGVPVESVAAVRAVFHDLLRPGCQAILAGTNAVAGWSAARESAQVAQLRQEQQTLRQQLAASEAKLRRITATAADLRESLIVQGSVPQLGPTAETSERLFVPLLIEAAVLGEQLAREWRSGRLLDRGHRHGVQEAAHVLASPAPLIDVGQADEVQPEDAVLMGRLVVGKVIAVGQWTSTFLPVTDPDYRGQAQLMRDTADGVAWGAVGVLEGDGTRCLLRGISTEQTVQLGDFVFTADRDGVLSDPLCYGRVVEVERSDDPRQWQIVVEPPPRPAALSKVTVLRGALNPQRLWAAYR